VVNYTYPDPKYRLQTDIGVAYGTHFHKMRQVINETVRAVEGVLEDKPVDVLYLQFGDSARLMRVRWWIDNIKNERTMQDRVNTALEIALDKAGMDLPFDTYNLKVDLQGKNPDAVDQSE
jgi:small-conductance mechanosensitive channel